MYRVMFTRYAQSHSYTHQKMLNIEWYANSWYTYSNPMENMKVRLDHHPNYWGSYNSHVPVTTNQDEFVWKILETNSPIFRTGSDGLWIHWDWGYPKFSRKPPFFCVGIIQYHLVIFLTVRHGKIHHAIQFGKPSISAIEKPWLALLVITRGYKKKSSDAASEIAQPGLSLAHLSKYCFHTSPERVSSACFVRCIDHVGSRWIKTKYETWV